MQAYIQTNATRPDGTKDNFCTVAVDAKDSPLWWQKQGLSYTASGYGSKIPTRHMVRFNSRWHRVYCRIYSNAGTCYIVSGKEQFIVNDIY